MPFDSDAVFMYLSLNICNASSCFVRKQKHILFIFVSQKTCEATTTTAAAARALEAAVAVAAAAIERRNRFRLRIFSHENVNPLFQFNSLRQMNTGQIDFISAKA